MLGLRTRSRYRFPVTLSASLIALNVTLMVVWIVLFARDNQVGAVTIGVIAFALVLVGLIIWLVLSVKEIALNHRQANFIGAVTHELKTPIASLRLYLETIRMRDLDDDRRREFCDTMAVELHRLDHLINQLLEVGRLDAVGTESAAEQVELIGLASELAEAAADRHRQDFADRVVIEGDAVEVKAPPIILRLILSNLIDNAFKYGGDPLMVNIRCERVGKTAKFTVGSNGTRIPLDERKRIFRVFYRGGSELERKQKGTGLGLYIVAVLVKRLKGRISVRDGDQYGAEFVLELPAA